jgi:hypothetical protein
MSRVRVIVSVGAALVSAGLVIAVDPSWSGSELSRNRALWSAQHLGDYRFRLSVRCFCPSAGHPVTVTVRKGRPHGATGFQQQLDTVPEMFGRIERALGDPKAGEVSVRFDARRGFPRSASIDSIKNAVDDEIGWTVDRFRVLR